MQTATTALQKKVATGREHYQARAVTLAKALRLSVAKLADEAFDLAMSMIGFTQETVPGDSIAELFDKDALLVILDGPNRQRGAASFDQTLVGGLIQSQTMGCVQPEPADSPKRQMTGTDAAMVAPFLDGLMSRAETLPQQAQERELLEGFRFGARAADARTLSLVLEAQEYMLLRLTLDIAGGQRQGAMTLVLPVSAEPVERPDPTDDQSDEGPRTIPVMENTVMQLSTDLTVVLTRLTMSLAEAGTLAPGVEIPLGVNLLESAMVLTSDGRVVASGQLGQSSGMRAVRLGASAVPQGMFEAQGDISEEGITIDGSVMEPVLDDLPDLEAPSDALPDLPVIESNIGDLSDLPELDGDDMPDGLPDLPDMPDAPMAQSGELPDLPDLPDLPPLDIEMD